MEDEWTTCKYVIRFMTVHRGVFHGGSSSGQDRFRTLDRVIELGASHSMKQMKQLLRKSYRLTKFRSKTALCSMSAANFISKRESER